MEKKQIIKQMYKSIVSKDYRHPVFRGVHFYEDRCCATDTHVLVIYNETIPQLADKTIDENGNEVKGRWPNVDAVFPDEKTEYPVSLNLDVMRKAMNWWIKKPTSTKNDLMVLDHKAINIDMLRRVLNLIDLAGELDSTTLFKTDNVKAMVIESDSFRVLIMPTMFDEKDVDSAMSIEQTRQTVSFENLINDYAFNSWRTEKKESEDWLSKF